MRTCKSKGVCGVLGHSRILTKNLEWVEASEIRVGDELIAFQEVKSPYLPYRDSSGSWLGQGGNRRVCSTKVLSAEKVQAEAISVLFSDDTVKIFPKDLFWVGRTSSKGVLTWIKTKDLVNRSAHIVKYMNVWDFENSYDAGWLSGFMDGEGSLNFSDGSLSGMQACQRPTVVWDRALRLFSNFGIKYSDPSKKVGGVGRGDCEYVYISGKWNTLEIIGRFDITRFKHYLKERDDCFGTLTSCSRPTLTIKSVVEVGITDFFEIKTEAKTYFCDGFAIHE